MSADTRQTDLWGVPVFRAPRSARSAALHRLPRKTKVEEAAMWAQLAYEGDSERVLAWLERAKDEGVIVLEDPE